MELYYWISFESLYVCVLVMNVHIYIYISLSLFQCCVNLEHITVHFAVRCSIWKQLYSTILILIGWMGFVPNVIQHSGILKKYCCKTVNIWWSCDLRDKQVVYKCFAWGCKQTNWSFSTWYAVVNVCVCVCDRATETWAFFTQRTKMTSMPVCFTINCCWKRFVTGESVCILHILIASTGQL